MTPRQATVLRSVVREYIRTGEPVGSLTLSGRGHFPWSSATIRIEFSELEDQGYVAHEHVSSGRIPTTRGFRYYVDHYVDAGETPRRAAEVLAHVAEHASSDQALARDLAQALARLSGTLAIVALGNARMHEAGLGQLLRMREFAESGLADDLEQLLDVLPERSEELATHEASQPLVFINGENPYAHTAQTSIVVAARRLPSGAPILAALIGPIRMPYDRHVRLLGALSEVMDQLTSA